MAETKTLETQGIVCVLYPRYTKEYVNATNLFNTVNGLFDYAIDLYQGISRNNGYCFGRSFNYKMHIDQDRYVIWNSESDQESCKKFLDFISILEFLFIDEEIYLAGNIYKDDLLQGRDAFFGQMFYPFCNIDFRTSTLIFVSDALSISEKTVSYEKETVLSFLSNVYSYSPYQSEKGNFKRHIVCPLKRTLERVAPNDEKKYAGVISLVNSFCVSNGYEDEIIVVG